MFEVGDKVYCIIRDQEGVVTHINKSMTFPVSVAFPESVEKSFHGIYTLTGQCCVNGGQVLFHGKPTIIPPRRKIKKYLWAYQFPNDSWCISSQWFADKEELLNKWSHIPFIRVQRIDDSVREIEVDNE